MLTMKIFIHIVQESVHQFIIKILLRINTKMLYSYTVDSHLPVKSPMRSDRHCARFFSARIRSQSNDIKGDHHCGQTTIPDYGHIFVAKRQIQSLHCGQMGIFNISL